jgi:phosphoribosylformylglycinamidine cyclo-ligase
MGLGMVLAVDKKDVDTVLAAVEKAGEKAYVVGEIVKGEKGVELC